MPSANTVEPYPTGVDVELDRYLPAVSRPQWEPPEILHEIDRAEYDTLSYKFGNYKEYMTIREYIVKWSGYWGGRDSWPYTLEEQYKCAKEGGPHSLKLFYRRVWNHKAHGR